ncbi:hypothetical protein J3R30DRAFT_3513968 [Lentinula aciculospora]|uniref:Uncharacterized protein n=1 Tax=Lentinula aciculospora TaxID=153920 RepID=A0A9W9DKC4_9AGAR|nr:hypothetical protein J3R30DRAFT_3513968 [Lentinula aciculospora]
MDVEKTGSFLGIRSKILSLMRPTSPYDEHTTDQYALYEHRIRGLSTAIWLTQIQPFPLGAPPKEPRILRAYRAIATLLTASSNEEGPITVTGAPEINNSLFVTVIAPRFYPDSAISCAPSRRIGDQKPSISVETISINNVESPAMQDLPEYVLCNDIVLFLIFCIRYGPAHIDIVNYSADIFRNLLYMSQDTSLSSESLTICQLILSRCWVEVKARLDAARFLLEFHGSMTLVQVLECWSPWPEDALTSRDPWEIVGDPYLVPELQRQRIPMQQFHNDKRFYFGLETASCWMIALCETIDDLHNSLYRYASNDSSRTHLTRMARSMRTLAHLLNTQSIQKIINSRSLQIRLDKLRKRRSYSSFDIDTTGLARKIIEDERKKGETAGHHILRYLFSLVSWYKAATVDLPNLMMRLPNRSPVLHIVKVPILRPQGRLKMQSPILIAREELNRFLTAGDIECAYTEKELHDFNVGLDELFTRRATVNFPSPSSSLTGSTLVDFLGSVHSLSVALAVMSGDSSSSSPHSTSPHWGSMETNSRTMLPFMHSGHISPEYLVKPSNGGFATSSKRCCYCCSLLDEILASSQNTPSSDSLLESTAPFRDHYGVVVPWTPPPLGYGLSIKTLALLERELNALLLGGILKNLDHVFSTTNEARAHLDDDMLPSYWSSGSPHSP